MSVVLLIVIIAIVIAFLLALVLAILSHHKKSATRAVNLIGATGFIVKSFDPEGTVIVQGDLWRARAMNSSNLNLRNQVRVVGAQAHLLLVESVR